MNAEIAECSEPLKGRRERFCQDIAAGLPLYDAFTAAGWKRPGGNANRLLRDPAIIARIKEAASG